MRIRCTLLRCQDVVSLLLPKVSSALVPSLLGRRVAKSFHKQTSDLFGPSAAFRNMLHNDLFELHQAHTTIDRKIKRIPFDLLH